MISACGNLLGVNYSPASFSFNAAGTILTLNYTALPEDNYTLTLVAGGPNESNFTDTSGNPLDGELTASLPSGNGVSGGDFVITFGLDPASEIVPAVLVPVAPLGSLVYQSTASRAISYVNDTDRFTVLLAAGQSISAVVAPKELYKSSLQPTVQLLDPNGVALTSSSRVRPGRGGHY